MRLRAASVAVGRAAKAAVAGPGGGTAEPAVCGKPVLAVMMAVESFYEGLKSAHHLPPVYRFPESAALALAQLVRYGEWRRRPEHEALPDFDFDRKSIAGALARPGDDGYLATDDAFRMLEALGIPVARWAVASDRTKRSPPRGGSATRWW